MDRVFTVEEAAKYLRVTPYTIRKWLRKGKLPGRKIGRIYRIFEAELEMALRAPAEDIPQFLEPEVSLSSQDAARAAHERVLQEERRRKHEEWNGLSREEKQRRIEAGRGKYADVPFSSDDLIRERREEAEREELRLGRSLGQAGERQPLLNEMVRRIREAADPERIILFGSRARGDARADSDFDLLVVRESDEPRYRRSAPLFSKLADLPVEVEVVVYTPEEIAQWRNVPRAFITRAIREGEVSMRGRDDLIRGWLKKAGSDFVALEATIEAEAYDAACFHAQQAAEKCLKAYLDYEGIDFPFTHNLTKLVELCGIRDPEFSSLLPTVEPLTPYAVETRYDSEFWPEKEIAEVAGTLAQSVRSFVLARLPTRLSNDEEDPTAVS